MKIYFFTFFTILKTAVWAQLPGNALVFNGINDYVDCGNDASLNINDALTLEAWIKTSTITNARIISKWGNYSGYEMAFINDDLWFTINQTVRSTYAAGTFVDQWTHLAVTYDGVNSAIYVNGDLKGTGQNLQEAIVNTGLILKIGQISNSSNASFSGSIDEVRIWKRKRTQAQIQSTMDSTLGPQYYSSADSGLVGYWQFEEGEGDTAYDLSVYGNHGIIHGALWSVTTRIDHNSSSTYPGIFNLSQNYPNPFNPSTTIKFSVPRTEFIKIDLYNLTGEKVQTILNKQMIAGEYEVKFNAQNLASGIYFYRIEAGEFQDVKKMIILR